MPPGEAASGEEKFSQVQKELEVEQENGWFGI